VRLHAEPAPVPRDGEVVVRITAVGLCGSDLHWYDEGAIGETGLAAPLVLDLVRLVSAAHAAGRSGAIPELGFFFKDPVGGTEHRLTEQWHELVTWRRGLDS